MFERTDDSDDADPGQRPGACEKCHSLRFGKMGKQIESEHEVEAMVDRQGVGARLDEKRTCRGIGMRESPVTMVNAPARLACFAQCPNQEAFRTTDVQKRVRI